MDQKDRSIDEPVRERDMYKAPELIAAERRARQRMEAEAELYRKGFSCDCCGPHPQPIKRFIKPQVLVKDESAVKTEEPHVPLTDVAEFIAPPTLTQNGTTETVRVDTVW